MTTAEVGGVQTFFHAGDDFGGGFVTAQHVGVGHARHRHVGITFTPAIAGGLDAHQAGVERVLNVALENAVLDQHIALAGIAFIVHIE